MENVLGVCSLAHATSGALVPWPRPASCLPSTLWPQLPSILGRVWKRTGVRQARQVASQGRTWPRLEAPWYVSWAAGQCPSQQGKRLTHSVLIQSGGFEVLVCSPVCHCRKEMLLAQLPQTRLSAKAQLRGLAAGRKGNRPAWQSRGLRYLWGSALASPTSCVLRGILSPSFPPSWAWVVFTSPGQF